MTANQFNRFLHQMTLGLATTLRHRGKWPGCYYDRQAALLATKAMLEAGKRATTATRAQLSCYLSDRPDAMRIIRDLAQPAQTP